MSTSPIKAVLFDLDGTLIDTAADLINALNLCLSEVDLPTQDYDLMRNHASHGSMGLLKAAALPELSDELLKQLQQRFLFWYQKFNGEQAKLFDGIDELLKHLWQHQIPTGVITNKPACYTRPLLARLGLDDKFSCIISGDTCTHNKPDIQQMLLGASYTNTQCHNIAYLGDAERDLIAAYSSKMQGMIALWGYIDEKDAINQWPATASLSHPLDLLDRLPPIDKI